jgi:hypothetical protein
MDGGEEDKEVAHLPGVVGLATTGAREATLAVAEDRPAAAQKRDEREELAWKTSAASRRAVENSRVFQGIDVGQKPIPDKPNASFGPTCKFFHTWASFRATRGFGPIPRCSQVCQTRPKWAPRLPAVWWCTVPVATVVCPMLERRCCRR